MPYDINIPGQVSVFELKAMEMLASFAPVGSTIVETGSLFGRSSYAWARSADPSVEVVCIDPFAGNKGVRSMEERLGVKYNYETFCEFTRDCENIRAIKGFSPDVVEGYWTKDVFLYFDDSVHIDPGFSKNLDFWSKFVIDGGVICGDDYRPRFRDIVDGVNRLEGRFGLQLVVVDFMWILLSKRSAYYDVALVVPRLEELAREAEKERDVFRGVKVEGVTKTDSKGSVSLTLSNPCATEVTVVCDVPAGIVLMSDEPKITLKFDIKYTNCFELRIDNPATKEITLSSLSKDGRSLVQVVQL